MFARIYFRSSMSGLDSIPVSQVMTREVKTIQENEIMQQVCKIMIQNDIGGVIVVAAQSVNAQVPVGIVTGKDIVRNLAEKPISFSSPINQIMSKPIVTIHPNASLQDALATMQSRNIRRLLVMSDDGNNMAGIITDKDIIKYITRNESVSSGLINQELFARNREMAERLDTAIFDDVLHRRP